MPSPQHTICIGLILALVIISPLSTFAVEYEVGLSTGQWIKYGDYEVTNAVDLGAVPIWSKLEVSAVADKRVLFYATGFYRNGSEFYYHAERSIEANNTLLIAANLTHGDPINPSEEAYINKTESRSYLGVTRAVNIFKLTSSVDEDLSSTAEFVYDQITGILLEYNVEENVKSPQMSYEYKYAYSIVDTNIFGNTATTETPEPTSEAEFSIPPILGAALIASGIAALLIIGAMAFRSKRK